MVILVDYTFVDAQLGPQHSSSSVDNVGIEQLHAAHKLLWLSHLNIYDALNHLIYGKFYDRLNIRKVDR